jgi:hypothetical protein
MAYDVNAAFMSCQPHDSGIHAVWHLARATELPRDFWAAAYGAIDG